MTLGYVSMAVVRDLKIKCYFLSVTNIRKKSPTDRRTRNQHHLIHTKAQRYVKFHTVNVYLEQVISILNPYKLCVFLSFNDLKSEIIKISV